MILNSKLQNISTCCCSSSEKGGVFVLFCVEVAELKARVRFIQRNLGTIKED